MYIKRHFQQHPFLPPWQGTVVLKPCLTCGHARLIMGQGLPEWECCFRMRGERPAVTPMHCLQPRQAHDLFVATHPCHPPVPYAHSCLLAVQQAMVDFAFLLASIE